MNWRSELLTFGAQTGRRVYESEFGLGIEFDDGADAFWMLPGEPMSTVEIPEEQAINVQGLIAEYERLNQFRTQAIHVIRQACAREKIVLTPHQSGEWSFDKGSCCGSISVGESLTVIAMKSEDIVEVISSWQQSNYFLPGRLSPEQIRAYLATELIEADVTSSSTSKDDAVYTISDALAMMSGCRVLSKVENWDSPDEIRAAAEPKGRIVQMLKALSRLLPDVSAAFELTRPGTLELDFSDGYDDFPIRLLSKDFARRFRGRSPQQAAEDIAREFKMLDERRSAVVNAAKAAAAIRHWNEQFIGSSLILATGPAGMNDTLNFGVRTREVTFEVGRSLTELLREAVPSDVIPKLFRDDPEFSADCLTALSRKIDRPIELPAVALRPKDTPPEPELLELDKPLIAEIDALADVALESAFQQRETLAQYRRPEFHDPERDHWLMPDSWIRLAEKYMKDTWPDSRAVLILLDAGDARGEAAARQQIEQSESHFEAPEEVVEFVWRFRHEYPERARAWFAPGELEGEFDELRARLGDPVAQRRITPRESPSLQDLEMDDAIDANVVKALDPKLLNQLHQQSIEWARTEHRCTPLFGMEHLCAAEIMGWQDVAQALTENPYLLSGLLTIDQRGDQYDEPGILFSFDLLLLWSHLAPSQFLAQLSATAFKTDLAALANEAGRRAAEYDPEVGKWLNNTSQLYERMQQQIHTALAIAWKRCRHLI